MKKLGIYFMMLAMMAVTFVGCGDKDEPNPPVITMPSSITIDMSDLNALEVNVAVTSADEELVSVKVFIEMTVAGAPTTIDLETITFESKEKAWTKTYTIADFNEELLGNVPEGVTLAFCIEAKAETTEASKSAPITIIPKDVPPIDTPLEGPLSFTWNRKGSADGTGLAQFGLAWTSNTPAYIVITHLPGAKLVVLEPNDWTALATKEALAAAVEAGTGVEKWEAIPTKATFNYVIATKTADGKYYLLNPTERTISPSDPGDRTVTGQYKF